MENRDSASKCIYTESYPPGIMGRRNQFLLLLWKNYVIQKRKVFVTILEVALPTLFSLILIFIRLRVTGVPVSNGVVWDYCDSFKDYPPINASYDFPRKIVYSPDVPVVRWVMRRVDEIIPNLSVERGFNSEDKMVEFLMIVNKTMNNTRDYVGGIVFTNKLANGDKTFADSIEYKIRLSSSPRNAGKQRMSINPFKTDTRWSTNWMFPFFQRVGPRESNKTCGGDPGYSREGFLAIQNAVNMAIIEKLGNGSSKGHERLAMIDELKLRRHPYPPYNDDNFVLVIQQQFPLILMLSFVLIALNIVKDVVHEKERRLKESMKMMGLSNWLHWTAWFVKYLVFIVVTIAIITLFVCIHTDHGPVIGKSDPSYLPFLFASAVSVFFSRANSAAAAGGILFFVSYFPYFFLQPRYSTLSWGQKIASSIVSNVAMAYGGQVIGMFEGVGSGAQWSNFNSGVSVDDDFALSHVCAMLVIDALFYCVITWYVETVFPGEFGVPQPWYFFLTHSYWCGTSSVDEVPDDKRVSIGQNPEYFEPDPIGINAGIQIRNLGKVFGRKDSKKVAVAGMSLDMYEGQITALLGHNGAGKTTTMKDIGNVRSSLGLCPQHDILFDSLTVEEHLTFFAKLKGCPSHQVNEEVDNMLESINLQNKRHAQSKTLSGGMKRKLSVGIALIGGSKIVILDEPSSGMDPNARRQIWTVLQNHRAGRTMVLTTHFMDEADLLGDRIAIMADGVVKCCGSSLFLKNKYGAGYHMVIVKDKTCNVNQLIQLVKSYVPLAKVESNVGSELSFVLPHESSSKFESMFLDLEGNKESLGIASYGASVTTMEEVFLRVKESADNKNTTSRLPQLHKMIYLSSNSHTHVPLDFDHNLRKESGTFFYYIQQFYALFLKRAHHTMRNALVTITQLAVPLFFTIMALTVVKTFPGPADSPSLKLVPDKFGSNIIVYSESVDEGNDVKLLGKYYSSQFHKKDDNGDDIVLINNKPGYERDANITKYLLERGKESIPVYNLKYMIAADFEQNQNSSLNATAYFNDQAYHSPAISFATLSNAILRYVTNSSRYDLTVVNHPLPRTDMEKLNDEIYQSTTGFTVAFNVVFGMAFLSSSFVIFLIKERDTKAKHIQFVSGVHAVNFWVSTFCWDMINFVIPCICLLVTFVAFGTPAYSSSFKHICQLFLLFILYGWSMLPLMYLLSFLFNVPSSGFVWLTMFNILTGIATILAVGILSMPQLGLEDLSHVLEWIFLTFLPNYCLGQGLEDFYSNKIYLDLCTPEFQALCFFISNPCCAKITGKCGSYPCVYFNENFIGWEKNGIGRMLVFLASQGVVYFCVLLFIDSGLFHKLVVALTTNTIKSIQVQNDYNINDNEATETSPLLRTPSPQQLHPIRSNSLVQEDTDVATERARLANTPLEELFESESLIVQELTKYYSSNLAVDRLSVGIKQGECFGLLGINGAGKTTTFKMLTGDEIMTSGEAYLSGYSVKDNLVEVRQEVGYCPQYDALIDQMTGRETLVMFARLRGVYESKIKHVVDNLLEALLLSAHADRLVKAYSGGNKRKLSAAIALVGNPAVIFLDEPTTGMDPVARRYLWDALTNVRDSGRTLVLTSHSMEECEALCNRLAIMVNGQFRCLGSPQHLKTRFGEGYTLLARVTPQNDGIPANIEPLMRFIEQKFPGSVLKDVHQGMVHYHILDQNITWAELFGTMEKAKTQFNIEDYSVSQTTLEQVFINFAHSQNPPQEQNTGCCGGCCFHCCGNGEDLDEE
ncbi:hypothetical protein KUTeg_003042 [Tegillarca granosa]|uniref:ABC transporter domain-containing protein n=1 Tax=Tegillarca granosa TaxID=220873 RepID=A0ABQ9FP63_TEGGR|nr:hypothetical protein KUTeg_003042 [Tegillarca granosa]